MTIQSALRLIYPPQCLICRDLVESRAALCGACWGKTPFINGLVCDRCGVPLPGEGEAGRIEYCDACLSTDPAWDRGRAAMLYAENGRRMVLSLKHGDRHDLVKPLATWMAGALAPLVRDGMVVVCVPAHRWRLLRRRFNQAALLSGEVAGHLGLGHFPDALCRRKSTIKLDGLGREARAEVLEGAIGVLARQADALKDRDVLIIDDVMTTGATFRACAAACKSVGARQIIVGAAARVALTV